MSRLRNIFRNIDTSHNHMQDQIKGKDLIFYFYFLTLFNVNARLPCI